MISEVGTRREVPGFYRRSNSQSEGSQTPGEGVSCDAFALARANLESVNEGRLLEMYSRIINVALESHRHPSFGYQWSFHQDDVCHDWLKSLVTTYDESEYGLAAAQAKQCVASLGEWWTT